MNERLYTILRNPWTIPVAVGVSAFGSGLGVGYILGNRRKVNVYEPEKVNLNWPLVEDTGNTVLVEERVVEITTEDEEIPISEMILETKVKEIIPEVAERPIENHLEFAGDDEDWDYEVELAQRDSEYPYVIHKDEFWEGELDFTQSTITFYAGDNIMTDEDDTPIYNYEVVTGELKFGHGSSDPNVVYIRNEKRRAEYEILLHTGLFSKEILDLEIENNVRSVGLQHSGVRRFRPE